MSLRTNRVAKLETTSIRESKVHVIQANGWDDDGCRAAREIYATNHTIRKHDLVVVLKRLVPTGENVKSGSAGL